MTVDDRTRASAALQQLLHGCAAAVPADLPRLTDRAARTLGVDAMTMYLVDYAQTFLTPFTSDGKQGERITIEGTLGGHAYALCEPAESPTGDSFWFPLTDCGHRVGVLEVVSPTGLHPADRDTCSAIATVLAQLVATRRLYGDAIEHLRRGLPMQLATEIVWSLLPPLTLVTDAVEVTGILEPCYEVGGDAFDYAVSDGMVHVALFDAVGHGISASAMTTMAVNAYRNARRCGLDLVDSCRSIDKWMRSQYPDQFVTAMIGELELRTGVLRTVSAGHPGGLLLRNGQRVKDLPAPTWVPLGLSELAPGPPVVVEEALQPGDHVLFYTDGVIEARNDAGDLFGRQRLVDFVVRTFADRVPVPETMRRLIRSLLEYQHEHLQDDATAMLLGWPRR